jgi:ABC-type transport system substrate-binding protein
MITGMSPSRFGLLFIFVLIGCSNQAPQPQSPSSFDSISIRALENPQNLDPAYATRTLDGHLTCLIHSGLVRCASNGGVTGEIADSWEPLQDGGYGVRFLIHPGLRFPSGRPVSSEDVIFSYSRLCRKDTGSPHAWVFEDVLGYREVREGSTENLSGIRACGNNCVEIELKEPSATLLARLTMPAARIVDRRVVAELGDTYGRSPQALGAWEIEERVDDSHLTLRPNRDCPWRNRYLSHLKFVISPQDFSATALFETGGLDVLHPLPLTQASKWKASGFWKNQILRIQELNVYYLGFGCHRPPLDRIEVRRALASVIHPHPFREVLFGDRATDSNGPIPPGILGYQTGMEGVPARKNPPEAAGDLQGLDLELWYIESDTSISHAMEAIQADLTKAGVHCRLCKTDAATYSSWRREGKFDLFFANWWADYPDPDNFLSPLFLSGSSSNMTRFSDPETDSLIVEAGKENRGDVRERLYQQAVHRIRELAPVVFLWHRNTEILHQPWVQGLEPAPLFHGTLYLNLRVEKR